jgi:excisionase family DNA binding protein
VLGVSEGKFRQMLARDGIPCIRTGSLVLIPVDGLRAWLQARAEAEKHTVEDVVKDALKAVTRDGT